MLSKVSKVSIILNNPINYLKNGDAGGTVIMYVSLATVTRVRFRLHAVIRLKFPWSHVRRVLSNLTLPSIAGFLRVLRFPPV